MQINKTIYYLISGYLIFLKANFMTFSFSNFDFFKLLQKIKSSSLANHIKKNNKINK